jgi:hypothetical protein
MKAAMSKKLHHAIIMLSLLAFTFLLAVAPAHAAGSNSLMITQFYPMGGTGGSAPSTYTTNYVEIYNNGYAAIDLTNWTIQFQAASGAMSTSTSYYLGGSTVTYANGFTGILQPGQYMLVQTATAGAGNANLSSSITPDLNITATTPTVAGGTAAIATLFNATAGQIALVNGTTPVTCTGTTPSGAADFVGYGTASCYEGAGAVAMSTGSSTKVRAYWRGTQSPNSGTGNTGVNLCSGDTDNNNPDFQYVSIQTKSTYNQDQSWSLHNTKDVWKYNGTAFALAPGYTVVPTPACGAAEANPAHVMPGETTTFSVTVNSTQISVTPFTGTADLSQLGLSATEPLTDDGTGTNTLVTAVQTIPGTQALGTFKIPFTVQDSATTPASVTVPKLPFVVGTPAAATLTVSSTSAAYGKSKTFVYTITPGPCTVTKQPTYTVIDPSSNVVVFPWPVGTNTVTASGALSPDCVFTYVAGTFTVSPGTQTSKISCPSTSNGVANTTYTGSPIACPVTATYGTCDPATFTGINGTAYGPITDPPTNVGSYDVEEMGACHSTNPNYGDPSIPSGVTLTIAQGTPHVKVNCNNVLFNGQPQACTPGGIASVDNAGLITIPGSFSPLTYSGVGSTTYGPDTAPPTNIGSYSVSTSFTPTDTVNWATPAPVSGLMNITGTPLAVRLGDYDGDGRADLNWHNDADGHTIVWRTNLSNIVGYMHEMTISDTNWVPVANVDLNGDGKSDMLWYNKSTGATYVWITNDSLWFDGYALETIADTNWKIVGTGDFNNDHKTDILWRNKQTGDNTIWLMNGGMIDTTVGIQGVSDQNWQVVTVADFDGNGKADILWGNSVTGALYIWFMDGGTLLGGGSPGVVADPAWQIAAVADFNGDNKAEILWRNAVTGDNYMWMLNADGTLASGAGVQGVADQTWQIAAAGDLNGDGKADLVWRNISTGANYAWFMDGSTLASSAPLEPVPVQTWKLH